MQRTFKVCDEALQQAGLIARDLDGVILVGGPTRLPLIRKAVREYFQQEPTTDVDPDEVVAMGAAIHAASLRRAGRRSDAYLLDVTPLSLRIGVAGGLTEPVIERNTPVPIEQTRTFTTVARRPGVGEDPRLPGRVARGERERAARPVRVLGFQRGARGEVEIDVTFEINTDGIVNVTASDSATGQQASTRITLSSGLSEHEIENIIDRGVASRVQTADGSRRAAASPRRLQPRPPAAREPAAAKPAPLRGARDAPTPTTLPRRSALRTGARRATTTR